MDQSLILLCLKKFWMVPIFFKGRQIIKFLKFIYNLDLFFRSRWSCNHPPWIARPIGALNRLACIVGGSHRGSSYISIYSPQFQKVVYFDESVLMRETRFSGTRFLPTNLNSHVNGTNPENLHVFNFKLSITPYKEKW